ncbi:spinster family MFS transporter [Peristeroidobacter soli]|uniref:spinster family MFS transporter n=1 Tax=Peristeroidobacter soli TaxID=2497877 RepID=UPI00101D9D62|nr:MFS transporter [Peristeroidobacter soli]
MLESRYKNYLLTVLLVIFASNYLDRLTLGLLLEDIRAELALTDTQLGFLTGLAFAMFHAVLGVPIARWADRGNRVTIISVTAMLWGGAMALCGVAANFTQLLLTRVCVAVGEAGCQPPALSLISDTFSRAERPRAIARYMLGLPIALIVGNLAAGWLNELFGWRTTFMIVGIPGFALGILAAVTLKEPRLERGTVQPHEPLPDAQPSAREVAATLWRNDTFRHLLFAFCIQYLFVSGMVQWQAAFFMRSHGMSSGEIGTWLALAYGGVGFLGTYVGGELATRYAAHDERLQLLGTSIAFALLAVLKVGVYVLSDMYWALGALAATSFMAGLSNGPMYSVTQTLVPPHMRAVAIALILLIANLIGAGFGPLIVGVVSDLLRPWVGEESLRYSLLLCCPGYGWAAWHLWKASGSVQRDLPSAAVEPAAGIRIPREPQSELEVGRLHKAT